MLTHSCTLAKKLVLFIATFAATALLAACVSSAEQSADEALKTEEEGARADDGAAKATEFVQYHSELGKKILYKPSQRVEADSLGEVQPLIDEMIVKMRGQGVGLAANQVGYPLQVFIIEYQPSEVPEQGPGKRPGLALPQVGLQAFINPRIVRASSEKVSFWHGCLSALEQPMGKVATYKWVDYEAWDRDGKQISGRLDDFAAVVFQHEFRHLLGSLYTDHTSLLLTRQELYSKLAAGEEQPYQLCGDEVPLLLNDYIVGESIEDYAKRRFATFSH